MITKIKTSTVEVQMEEDNGREEVLVRFPDGTVVSVNQNGTIEVWSNHGAARVARLNAHEL